MTLSELLPVVYAQVELHNGYDGKLVATNKDSLQKYGNVEVLSVYAKMKAGRDGDFARPYLYVFGSSRDIEKIKKGEN